MVFNLFIINDEIMFDVNANELRSLINDRVVVALNAPTARCLQLLLESQGEVVSREEFLESVWKTRGIIVSENTFYQNISLLRKSLTKAGLSHEIIVTIRQRGFVIAEGTVIKTTSLDDKIISVNGADHQGNIGEVNELLLSSKRLQLADQNFILEKKNDCFVKKDAPSLRLSLWTLILVCIMTVVNIVSLFL
ncbi:MAG: winged helix-turn-helix domain-containing protein [Leclercia adecarboxylata]|nr:winged helix-turn-helix domain-containing protein [uncultured Leclercia sp.]MDU4840613.1 winged helix-turn-helix domain-containing protein [Leclercia adecarboxylata]